MREALEEVLEVDCSRAVGSRSGSTVRATKLEGDREVLGDELVIRVASKAVDISHHMCRAMEDLKEITKKFLGPSTNLMDRTIIFENFLDGTAVAKPKEFSTPEKFPVLPTGFSDERMVVALTLGTAARSESSPYQYPSNPSSKTRAWKNRSE